MTRRGVLCVRMVSVSYVMKVLWKILCISCSCGEFSGDRERLLGMIERTVECMAECRNKGDEVRFIVV